MLMALAGLPRPADGDRAWRRHAAADQRSGRRRGADDRRALRAMGSCRSKRPPILAAAPARRRAAAVSSWARPPPRRSSPKRSASPSRTPRSRRRGSRSGLDVATPLGARRSAHGGVRRDDRQPSSPTPRSATRWSCTPRSADRRTCCCTFPPSRTPRAAGRPTIDDWIDVNRQVPRLVDVLPNGPHPTVRVFLAGGVPEVMLHLRARACSTTSARTVSGASLGDVLELVGGIGAAPARCAQRLREARRRRSRRRDPVARTRRCTRSDQHRQLHPRQPRARRAPSSRARRSIRARSMPTAFTA